MPIDAEQIADLEAELDALSTPTTAEVLLHSRDYEASIVGAVALNRGAGPGGGSLPDWWEVDSTAGEEEVEFKGVVAIAPTQVDAATCQYVKPPIGFGDNSPTGYVYVIYGETEDLADPEGRERVWTVDVYGNGTLYGVTGAARNELRIEQRLFGSATFVCDGSISSLTGPFQVFGGDNGSKVYLGLADTDIVGFYGSLGTAKQTGVAVTAEAIHAALVALGLIGA